MNTKITKELLIDVYCKWKKIAYPHGLGDQSNPIYVDTWATDNLRYINEFGTKKWLDGKVASFVKVFNDATKKKRSLPNWF